MTVVAFVTSALTSREKENAKKALEKERETQALYRLTSHLTEAKELSDAAETAVSIISDLLGCQDVYKRQGRCNKIIHNTILLD